MSTTWKQVDTYRINLQQKGKNLKCPSCGNETFLPPAGKDVHRQGNVYICEGAGCTAKRLVIVKGKLQKKVAG